MSLVTELKRRNVIRVAIAYLAGSWLLIQVAETLLPIYGFTDSAIRILVAVLGIGFVIAIVFAWVFELTPEGLKKESEVDRSKSVTDATGKKLDRAIIVVLLAALAYFAFDKLVLSESRIESARLEGRTEALIESYGEKSIAVLPFVDMSSTGDQEYMGDGIAEELLNLLAKVPELRVISRSSAFSFKGKGLDVPAIAEQLKVVHILEGSVRKAGSTIRITAQLIDARSDTHLWSETYDRELTDIFAIQDEISASVVNELKIVLLGAAPTLIETDPVAYELFLQARYFHENDPSLENMEKALALYQSALVIDDTYVPAWVWLAAGYADYAPYGVIPADEALALMESSIASAVALDPNDPLVLGLKGTFTGVTRGKFDEGTAMLQRALAQDPLNLMLLRWSAITLGYMNRPESAIPIYEYLLTRDPLGYISILNLAESYLNTGRYDAAIELLESRREILAVTSDPLWYILARAYIGLGDAENGSAYVEKIEFPAHRLEIMARVFHLGGQATEFDAVLEEILEAAESDSAFAICAASTYAYIGNADYAFKWAEKALEIGIGQPFPLDDRWTSLHDDPRWLPFLESIGRSPAQLDAIEFKVTLP